MTNSKLQILRVSPRSFILTLDGRILETFSSFRPALVSLFEYRNALNQEES